jgi:hypothetical protein
MIHLNFSDLNEEAKERLLESSKRDVENKFGSDIRSHTKENQTDFETMIEEEALRNLYTFKYVFKI